MRTFDRASYGFSDPPPRPQILSDVVDDLHRALEAGAISQPFVLLGNSLGGVEARLYAELWPTEVVGMILDDTSPAAEGLINQQQPDFDEVIGRDEYLPRNYTAYLLASHGPLDPSSPEYKDCSFTLPRDTPTAFKKRWPKFFTADYFAGQVLLMRSVCTTGTTALITAALARCPWLCCRRRIRWGTWNANTPAIVRFNRSYLKVWIGMHEALARLPRAAYTDSSRDQVTRYSWMSAGGH